MLQRLSKLLRTAWFVIAAIAIIQAVWIAAFSFYVIDLQDQTARLRQAVYLLANAIDGHHPGYHQPPEIPNQEL